MPPKPATGASKKTVQKKKQQQVEDKTFGLKNKNKSKKVQLQIQSIQKNVMNSGDPKMRKLEEARKKAKEDAKLRKKALEAEQNALFGEALLAVSKKSAINQKFGKVEAKGRDADDDDNKKQTSRAMKMMFQMDAKEMSEKLREDPTYVPTLEDEIEDKRQKAIEALKGKGTPVTPETFAVWQEKKRQRRAAELKKKVEMELRKKKGGKGLAVLSGRDLYDFKKELFSKVDEDENMEEDGPSEKGDDDDDDNNNNNEPTMENGSSGGKYSQQSSNDPNGDEKHGQSSAVSNGNVDMVAEQVQSDLFLQGDDDDLDDVEDD